MRREKVSERMNKMTFLTPLLICLVTTIFAIIKLKGKPLYFRIYSWASVCCSLSFLSNAVNYICDNFEFGYLTIALISQFGMYYALFSANFSQLDSIVDDRGGNNRKIRYVSFCVSLLVGIILLNQFCLWQKQNILYAVFMTTSLLPIVPASYFSIKHLLLPMDEMHFLQGTKLCNLFGLLLYCARISLGYAMIFSKAFLTVAISNVIAVIMGIIIVSATKGAKRWNF